MEGHALAPYEDSLAGGTPLQFARDDGSTHDLDVARWLGAPDEADRSAAARARGVSLDVGCGPGRIVEALRDAGRFAIGIDIATRAVAITRARGQHALLRNVLEPLPGEGRWTSVLLLDGNIGIGGDPTRLLKRVRDLLAPGGNVLVETHPDDTAEESGQVRFAVAGTPLGPPFAWSIVGARALCRAASSAGLVVAGRWQHSGRPFLELSAGVPS